MLLHCFKMEDIGREPSETFSVSTIFTIILFLMHIVVNNLQIFPQILMVLKK